MAAGPDERDRLAALFELYLYDFSEILHLEIGDDGRFRPPSLDFYWTDPRCHPFLIRVDGRLAGFALVQERNCLTGEEEREVCDVAEFFVLRRYRRRGVGERAARWIFDRFRGPWVVRQRAENRAATAFWRRTIERYTSGRFDDLVLDNEQWRGPVQRFDTSTTGASPAS